MRSSSSKWLDKPWGRPSLTWPRKLVSAPAPSEAVEKLAHVPVWASLIKTLDFLLNNCCQMSMITIWAASRFRHRAHSWTSRVIRWLGSKLRRATFYSWRDYYSSRQRLIMTRRSEASLYPSKKTKHSISSPANLSQVITQIRMTTTIAVLVFKLHPLMVMESVKDLISMVWKMTRQRSHLLWQMAALMTT